MKQSMRRRFVKNGLGLAVMTGLSGCTSSPTTSVGGAFVHMVFFWMKNPHDTESKSIFQKNLRDFLAQIAVINTYNIGVPANTPREVVDNSYNFSLIVTFDNKEGHDVYQEHPAHTKFIKETEHLWKKVLIYDALGA